MSGKKSYWELLRDPQWQRKRLEIMEAANFECSMCSDKSTTLNVHHSYYEKGLAPWEYPVESLHCLCEPCHEKEQAILVALHRQIGRLPLSEISHLLGVAVALEMQGDDSQCTVRPSNRDVLEGLCRVYLTLSGWPIQFATDDAVHFIEDGCITGSELFTACERYGLVHVTKPMAQEARDSGRFLVRADQQPATGNVAGSLTREETDEIARVFEQKRRELGLCGSCGSSPGKPHSEHCRESGGVSR